MLGTLRLGAQVARAAEPYTTHGCAGGWYPIRPRGWVCNGDGVSLSLDVPASAVRGPDLDKPMPYRYGRVLSGAAVSYATIPTLQQMQEAEPKRGSNKKRKEEQIGVGANDVPLNEHYNAERLARAHARCRGRQRRRLSHHNMSWWMYPGVEGPPAQVAGNPVQEGAGQTRVLKRKSGVAATTAFATGEGGRRFAMLTDGRFVPTDRLLVSMGTAWHGVDVTQGGLPVSFALRRGIRAYNLGKNAKVERLDEEFEPQEIIPLTGRFRTVNKQRFYATRDDTWVRHKDLIMVPKRHRFPDWATEEQKWIDVSLANQTMVLWQGHQPVYATLISSGSDRLGDPQTGPSTVQGVYRVRNKHISRNIDDREVGQAYSVSEAPWVMEFHQGFSITGCYWHRRFGEARSYHDIAVAPVDAHFMWHWADPQVPDGWHSVTIPEDAAENTIIYVHR